MRNFTFNVSSFVRSSFFLLLFLLVSLSSVAQVCGTPGADGPVNVSNSINTYYPIASSSNVNLAIGSKSVSLGAVPTADASNSFGTTQISAGDLVLIIQMQDATINYANSNLYGSGLSNAGRGSAGGTGFTDLGNSGIYEYVIATNNVPLAGGILNFTGTGTGGGTSNTYVNAAPNTTSGKKTFQIIRVPQFSNLTLGSNVTTPPFNGVAGGIIAFNVSGTFNFNGFTIDGSARGFRGGFSPVADTGTNNSITYVGPSTNTAISGKGEGIAGTPKYMWDGFNEVTLAVEGMPGGSAGRGAPANAGGGGNDHNSGGGGGGNGGYGGRGGDGWEGGGGDSNSGGRPGFTSFSGSPMLTRLIMGGGGGAGDANNAINGVKGGVGGAIILINAGNIQGTGIIKANGGDGAPGSYAGAPDGAGGGGAGGSVFLNISNNNTGTTIINIEANGGRGGNTLNDLGNSHGPGGGGGGGIIRYKIPGSGVTINRSVAGGIAGKTDNGSSSGENHRAQGGNQGSEASFTNGDLPANLQINSNCLAKLVTTVKSVTKSVCNKVNETVSYEIEITNTGSGNAAQVSLNFAFPSGINFDSATATYSGNASGLTGALTNNTTSGGSAARPIVGGFNIPLNGVVKITLVGKVMSALAAGPLSANAQAFYLDPTRTIAEPDRVITPLINAFTGSNTTYQTGGALPVDGTNFSGTTTTNDDIAVKAVPGIPTITAGGPVTFCQGNSVILTSSDGTSYLWSNGATSKSITVTASGNYSVQVTNSVGCQSNSSVETTVTVNQKPAAPVATAATALICEGFTANWNTVPGATSYGIAISTNELFSSNVLPFDGRDLGSNATSYNFTGLSGGDYYYRVWSYNSCGASAASSNTIRVSVAGTPTTSVAGPAQTLCEATTATLVGNTATVGTGLWTRISGTGTITNPSSATSGVTGLGYGANVFRWTISNGTCTASSSEVTITRYQTPTVAQAGSNQNICETATATLGGNPATVGTGLWTRISGTGTITNPSSATSGVTGLGYGANVFRWTISNGTCTASSSEVTITRDQTPIVAQAGSNQNICETATATLGGNPATVGTGLWTRISGTGTITNPSSATSGVTGLGYGANVFRWTISNGTCTASSSEVTITRDQTPTVAQAGSNQNICETATATLGGNPATVGTGLWTRISGTGTITNPSSATSGVTGLGYGANVFRWTISNGTCTASSSEVTITRDQTPTVAQAGSNQNICETATATLGGNPATVGTGLWTRISGTGTITNPSSATSGVTGLGYGANVFRWTISNGTCTASSSEVTITRYQTPTVAQAGSNQNICETATATLGGNPATVGTGLWTRISGTGTITNPSSATSGVTGLGYGANVFRWTISNGTCTASSSEVTIARDQTPTVAQAGSNQNICETATATLGGNPATVGTGLWTRISGTGTITNPSSATSGVTGLGYGANVFRWTISNGTCTASSSEVTITRDQTPTVAQAGSNQNICETATATLGGNPATVGTGLWTRISGTGTITNPSSATSGVTGLSYGANVFRWTISNGTCTASSSEVTITRYQTPTVAQAGSNQNICETATATLGGNPATVGTGLWTRISGTGTITNPSSATSGVTGLGYGANVFRWTISNGTCTASSSEVTITRYQTPTVAQAGSNQNICETATATLGGNPATVGTGLWTRISGTGTITNPSSATSGVTGLGYGANVFRWTISNGTCTASSSEVTITRDQTPIVAQAGSNQNICETATATLGGNPATVGTGLWTRISGTGTITNPSSATSGVTGLGYGANVFRWTISNGTCTASSSEVTITRDQTPTVAQAGSNQNICETATATLGGNPATVGTGLWTRISGTGTITNPSSATSGVTGLGYGANVFRWTISNGTCTASSSEVTITRDQTPTVAQAGSNQNICETATATLGGNPATVGTGLWTRISGTGTITNPSSATSGVTGLGYGANVFRWTISNGTCTASSSEVTITRYQTPTVAQAGSNQNICETATATLGGNPATVGTGLWTRISGTGTITNPSSATSGVTGLGYGANVFRWTISNGTCTASSSEVTITRYQTPTVAQAGSNQNICETATATLGGNPATVGTGLWTRISGTGTITNPSSATSGVTGLGYGANVFRWTISNGTCTASSSEVTIARDQTPTVAQAGSNQNICETATATLGGNPATVGTGLWTRISGTGTITNPSSATSGVTGLGYGANVFRWTISNGTCTASSSEVTITRDQTPTVAQAGSNQNICETATATLGGNPATVGTGLWTRISGTGTITNPSSATSGVTGLGYGANVFRWTISNGTCTASSSEVTITRDQTPTVAQAGSNQNICETATATLGGNPATVGTGLWTRISGTGTITNPSSATSGVTGLSYGANVFRWTISNGTCTASSSEVTITRYQTPTVAQAGSNQNICETATATLGGNPATVGTGLWTRISGTGTITNPSSATSGVTGLGYGANVFRWTISNGTCTASSSEVTITRTNAIVVALGNKTPVSCMGGTNGTITLGNVSGGTAPYVYSWSKTGDPTFMANTANLEGLSKGIYNYSVTDANNCTAATGTFTIVEPAAVSVSNVSQSTILCHSGSATVTITAAGGTGALSYTFDGVTNNSGVFTHAAGSNLAYSVTDANNCTAATGTFTIVEPAAVSVSNVSQSTILCHSGSATVTITAAGGTGALSYTFDGVTNNSGVFTHAAGSNLAYSVTDANNCTAATGTFTIVEPAAVSVSNVSQSTILCHSGSATVTITAAGGTGALSYTFDGVTNNSGVFTHAAGSNLAYSVTDANNCTAATGTFTIVEPAAVSVSNVSQSTILCHSGSATVTITAAGGTGALSYTFDGVTNNSGVFTHAAGSNLAYSVTDANNCTAATGTFTIVEPAAVSVSNVSQSTILCHSGSATVTITAAGGTGALSYTFDGVTNNSGVFTHAAGSNLAYSVTDANNCTAATGTFTIVEPAAVSVSNVSQSTILCHSGSATVTITAAGGTGALSYTFDGVTNNSGVFTHAAGSNLAYSVTDANNCTAATGTFTIVEPAAVSVSNVSQSTILCHSGSATVTITAAGGTGALSYTFDGVTNNSGVFTHAAGSNLAYSVTDANNCTAATGTFTIVEPAAVSVSNVSQSTILCHSGSATVTITAAGGTGALSYTFDGVTNNSGVFTHAAGSNLAYSVTDANNCTAATGTFTIVEPAAVSVSNVSQSTILCHSGSATVTITAAGGTGALSYTFDGVTNNSGVFTHAAGSNLAYSVTDANNCTAATGTFTIVEPAAVSVSNVSQSTILCHSGSATVTITAAGGTGALSYTFDGVTNNSGVFTHAAGSNLAYSVTDANNCTAATGTFTIVEPAAVSVSNVSQSTILCHSGSVTVTITAAGGTGALSYTFDGVTNNSGVFTHAAGSNLAYSVTDANNCTAATGTFTIVEPAAVSVSNVSQSTILCHSGSATVTITAAGGTGALSYTFDGVTNNSGVFTHAAGSNLAYSVTDANNCTAATGTFTIVEPAAVSVSNVSQSTILCHSGSATVTITAAGGTGALSYTFDGVTNNSGVFTHAAGSNLAYSVTDANNCTAATGTFTIVEPAAVSVSNVSQSTILCHSGSATVTITAAGGTGALSYTFDGVTNNSGVFTHAAGSNLAYSVTDANNCTAATGTFTIVEPAAVSVSNVSQSTILCHSGSATVTITAAGGTGALSYTFDGVTNNSGVFTHAAGSNLAYSVTDANNCTAATGTFTIVEPAAVSVSNVSQSTILCHSGSATVTITAAGGTGALSYTFDGVTNNSGVFTHAAGSNLAYSVTDANNCTAATGTFTIVEPAAVSVSNVSQSTILCHSGSATVTITAAGGTGALSYTFDGVTNNSGVFTHAAGSNLAYSVTDANNCTAATGTFTIVEPAAVSVSNVSQSTILCHSGSATVTITAAGGTGALSYTFDGVTNNSGVFTHAAGSNLAYSVTDANNCTAATGTFTIVEPAAVSVSNVSQSTILCHSGSATVTITAAGGTGALSYTFDGVTNNSGVFTHAAGSNLAYSVTDANNCTAATGTFTIVEPAAVSVSNVSQSTILCHSGSATVTITAAGGTGALSYTFDGVTNNSGVFTHAAGSNLAYSVTDANNCTAATGTFTIVEPAAVSVSNVSQSTILCHSGSATVTITAAGGTGALSYTFDGVTNNSGVFTHAAGSNLAYSVTDANNCTAATGTFTIVEPAAVSVSNVSQSTILCHSGSATVTITAAGGTGALSYTFDGVTNNSGVFTHAAGSNLAYSVTDANNCTAATGTFTIVEPAAVSVSNVSQSTILCHSGSATVTITAAGGTGALSYTFDGVTNNSGVFTHAAGSNLAYSVTDANNCTAATGTFTIVEPAAVSVSNVSQSTILCHSGSATVTITAAGGTGALSYTFDGVTNNSGVFTHAAGSNLAYSVTDANNCTAATGTFTIVEPAAVSVSNVSQSTILCHSGSATVTITAAGGTGALSYTFDGVTNNSGVFTHAAGSNLAYSVTDANNCTAATGTFTIVEPAAVSVSNVSQSTILCHSGSATVTITAAGGTGALSYTFDGVTNNSGVFTHAAGSNLAYSVTDANNCTAATGTFTIVEPAAVSVSNVSQSTILCHSGSATVTITAAGGTGALSYTFDGVTNNSGVFTHAAGSNLAYSVTDANNCTAATGTFTIVEPAAVSVSNVSQSTILCHSGSATVTITAAGGTGALSYTFDGVTNNSGVFTHAAGSNLAYSVTDANNCTAATGTFTIVEPAAVSVSNVSQSTILCHSGSATVTITAAGGTGALSYTFDGVTNNSGVFTHAAGSNLAYSVTDANNCTAATGTFTIVEPAAVSVSNVSQSTILCHSGSATVTITAAGGTGALSYTFDGVTNNSGVFTHAAGSNLAYSVTDANNCTAATGTFTIVEPAAVSVSNVSQSTILCHSGSATVTITAAGGTGALSYTFDGVTNNSGVFTHAAGSNLAYSVTDANNCTAATGTFTIVEPAAVSVSNVSQSTILCHSGSATVTITAAGGTGALSYTFDGVTNNSGVFTHAAGSNLAYSVTDANNCTAATGTFTIVEPAAVSVSNVSQSTILCHSGSATVTITAAGGTGALSYTFDGVTNNSGVFTHAAGSNLAYSVTDANNCTAATGTFTIVEPAAVSVSNVSQSTILCHSGSVTVTITAAGGTGALSYTFDGVTNNSGVFTHAAGSNLAYSVTDANNCTAATGTFTIVEPAAVSVSNVSQSTILCHSGSATVTITAAGGTGALSYTFDGVTNNSGVFTHAAGSNLAYSVTDANNCTAATGTFTIVEPAAVSVSNVSQSTILCHSGSATVTITAAGGTGALSYTFDGVTNNSGVFTHAAGSNLAYSVTDANNCTAATGTFTIVEPAAVSVSNVSQSTILCHSGSATVTITAAGGTGALSYTFDGVTNNSGVFTHAAGSNLAYSVTDANNCTAATGTFTIVEPAAVSVSNVSQSTILCHSGSATVTITAAGGTGALSYTFDGVTNNSGVFTHAAGSNLAYSVTDANNCTAATGTFTIVEPAAVSVSNVSQSTILCHSGSATVTITAAGGTGALSYTFDGVTNNSGVFTHAAGSNLAYSVTDANNCTAATGTFTIVEPAAVSVSNVSQSTILCHSGSATVTITAAGGTGALSYTFDGVTNNSGVFTHAAGSNLAYSVTDANNCTAATGTFTIVEPAAVSVSNVSQSTILCHSGSATVTITAAGGTGALSYTFDGVTNNSGVFTHAAGSNLAYSVTDANNCTAATGTFTIVEPAAVSVSNVSQSTILCHSGSATVTITAAGGTGALSYTFDGVTNNSGVFTHAAGSNLAYSVTDANNCTAATGTFTIVEPAAVSVSINRIIEPTCAIPTGSVEFISLPAGNWIINPGNIVGSGTSTTITGLVPGNIYNFTVTTDTGCSSLPSADIIVKNVICAVTETTASINGFTGGNTPALTLNDELNGAAVVIGTNPGEVKLTPVDVPTGLTLNADGTVTVAANTPAKNYNVIYKICEVNNPTNCDEVTSIVVVGQPVIDAVTETTASINGFTGGTTSALTLNDKLNGAAVVIGTNPGEVKLTPVDVPTGLTLNADGTVTVAANTPAKNYNVIYKICEVNNPTNCDEVTSIVVVGQPIIDAVTETTASINGFTGGNTPALTLNDKLNGAAVVIGTNPGEVKLTPVDVPTGLTLNADGTVTVAANTPAKNYNVIYKICEVNNPTNCDEVTSIVVVGQPIIDAVTETTASINGFTGGTTPALTLNDKLNGAAVVIGTNPGEVKLTPVDVPTGLTLNADGTVTVAANTPAKNYNVIYKICEVNNPTNCDEVTSIVVVGQPVIDAITERTIEINGSTGGTTPSLILNDILNGVPVVIKNSNGGVILTSVNVTAGLTLNADGTVKVNAGTPIGIYEIEYTICEYLNPTNCATIKSYIPVVGGVLKANDDNGGTIDTNKGEKPNVNIFKNDMLNGLAVNPSAVILTTVVSNPNLILKADGSIEVKDGTPVGDYELTYQICEVLNPTNCSQAKVKVSVENSVDPDPPVSKIVLGNDQGIADGINGSLEFVNVLDNDFLNDKLISSLDIVITNISKSPYFEFNSDGTVNMKPNTPGGNYTIAYQVCEKADSSNCSTGMLNVFVEVPEIALVKTAVFNDENGNGVANAGETITYRFVVTNTGNVPLKGVMINDPLVGVKVFGQAIDLNVNESNDTNFTAEYKITQADINRGSVSNQATVKGSSAKGVVVEDASDDASLTGDKPTVLGLTGCVIKVFNAFSPNGDAKNSRFYIQGLECYPNNTVEIYNRWGVLVFDIDRYNNEDRVFTGFSQGRTTIKESNGLPVGTYFYIIKYNDSDSTPHELSGYLYLNK